MLCHVIKNHLFYTGTIKILFSHQMSEKYYTVISISLILNLYFLNDRFVFCMYYLITIVFNAYE